MLNASYKSVITDYVSRHTPFKPRSDYFQYLLGLAVELRLLKSDYLDLAIEEAKHYVYVYLDPRKPGRYKYTLPSGKVVRFKYQPFYVGKGFGVRVNAHFKNLNQKNYKNHTFKAIISAGFDPKDYREITKTPVSDFLALALEIDLIAGIGRANIKTGPLTNLTNGGEGVTGSPGHKARLGKCHTDETKEKISLAGKGRVQSAATRLKRSISMTGLKRGPKSQEAIELHRRAMTGRPLSDEHKTKLSRVMTGKQHTEAAKQKMSLAAKGKPKSAAHRAKTSESKAGVPWSPSRRHAYEQSKLKTAG